ncbi:CsbD family protein [uncultured Amnibacterium sp.]|uniref:CsbD family protein n=1 Tax=uncultured Amnibacterium sp. TaxID=1631851 RepID=UPI0035C99900
MALGDKITNAAEDLTGKAKEAAGKATGNESLEAEGRTDQAAASVKQTGEDVKEVFR